MTRRRTSPSAPERDFWPLLVCPACLTQLTQQPTEFVCTNCVRRYPVVDGIPVMLLNAAAAGHDEIDHYLDHKRHQAEFYDRDVAEEFEVTRPHGTPRLYRWLLAQKFARSIVGLQHLLPGGLALTVCGGSGMDAEFLARAGATVISSDISLGAARRTADRARRYGLAILPLVADVEHLPFPDRSIDLVYVHDGLHHLEQPLAGIGEMARVAGRAVSVTEPARAAVTRLAVRAGLALEREDAGNRVARVTPAEVADALRSGGFGVVRAQRYAMYYRHVPGRLFTALSLPLLFPLTRSGWRVANRLVGRWGNKVTVQAVRER